MKIETLYLLTVFCVLNFSNIKWFKSTDQNLVWDNFFIYFLFLKVGLTSISSDTSRNLRGFQFLDLSFNELVQVPNDSFKGLGELRHLDVEKKNQISFWSSKHLSDNLNLGYLDLSENKISNIEQNIFLIWSFCGILTWDIIKLQQYNQTFSPSRWFYRIEETSRRKWIFWGPISYVFTSIIILNKFEKYKREIYKLYSNNLRL